MSRNLALTHINLGLSNYLEEIKKFPMLTWEEEYSLSGLKTEVQHPRTN